MFDYLKADFLLRNSFLACVLMGVFCPFIGRHLVFGRTILLGLALPQISLAGVAFVFLGTSLGWTWCQNLQTDFSKSLGGSLLFTMPTLCILAFVFRRSRQLSEGWLGFLFLAATSATHLLLASEAVGETYIEDLFHARLLIVSEEALVTLSCALLLTAAVAFSFRRHILLYLSDREFSITLGMRPARWELCLALLNGIVIGVAASVVGPLVTFGFLILPVLGASSVSGSLRTHSMYTILIGLIMGVLGFSLSYRWDLPLGATVVAVGCASFAVCKAFSSAFSLSSRHQS
jgi:ABC-type Mn2+/Zn2+ transport system permease subunit